MPRRKIKHPITINVLGKLADLMLGRVVNPKYDDPGSPIIYIYIAGNMIPKTLIDLGAAIDMMTQDIMIKLDIQNLLMQTTTTPQLADTSTVCQDGILENSW